MKLFYTLSIILFIIILSQTGFCKSPGNDECTVLIDGIISGSSWKLSYLKKKKIRKAEINFEIPDITSVKGKTFALELAAILKDPPSIQLNNTNIDFEAVETDKGWAFILPSGKFKINKNSILIKIPGNDYPEECEIKIFSLENTFEEAHFNLAFGKSDPRILAQPYKHPSQDQYDALHYELHHKIQNLTSEHIEGEVTITAKSIVSGLNQAALDFDINDGKFIISSVDNAGDPPVPFIYTVDQANDWIIVELGSPKDTDEEFKIHVSYSGIPRNVGGAWGKPYKLSTHSGSPQIYSFSQPYGAREWWPCKDVPEDKTTADLYYTVPEGNIAVGNGSLISKKNPGDGYTEFYWKETYPIATYLVSISCTNYEYVEGIYTALDGKTTMTLGHYVYPEELEAEKGGLEGTLMAMNFFAETYGEYPFLREKYVTAAIASSGMEHQTCTSLRHGGLIDGGYNWLNIHELSHQWFGDMVTIDHYDHVWIHEGYATYSEALFEEHRKGRGAYHTYVNSWPDRIDDTMPLVGSHADLFRSSLIYRKGGFVMHMLRHVTGDEAFFQACRNFLKNHAYNTALTPDLRHEFEKAYGKDLEWFFQQWVHKAGRPTYKFSWISKNTAEGNIIDITIEQTQSGNIFSMPIDIHITDASGITRIEKVWNNQKSQTYSINLGGLYPLSVKFDPENYILKNYEESSAAPAPTVISIKEIDTESAVISWISGGGDTDGFRILISDNLSTWTLVADEFILGAGRDAYSIENLQSGKAYYFAIQSVNELHSPGKVSDIYGARLMKGKDKVLIVDGLDRTFTDRPETHIWAARHANAVNKFGAAFDSCANEALINGLMQLEDYTAVIWVLGEESSSNLTFDSTEQDLVKDYLESGGNLFVTGAEIGWDLVYKNHGTGFYSDYLKAAYILDDSEDYTVTGEDGSIFESMSFSFDDGSGDTYFADFPDVIDPQSGGQAALRYNDTQIAGIQYSGTFPGGTENGGMVYLGFGFETVNDENARNDIMKRVLEFFNIEAEKEFYGESFALY